MIKTMQDSAVNPLVEIRLPTFKRPHLLRRALSSVVAQTYSEWRVIVIDDSTGQEAAAVVREFADERVVYQPNVCNLGRVENLNRAFASTSWVAAARFACVLEDDNYWDPDLLAANVAAMAKSNASVMNRNYRIEDMHGSGETSPNDQLPISDTWGTEARFIPYGDRVLEAFFTFTLGNFGYFWDLEAGIDISCEGERFNEYVAEPMRAVAFKQPCWYEPSILSTFTRFVSKNDTPSGERIKNRSQFQRARLSELKFHRFLLKEWVVFLKRPVSELIASADRRGCKNRLLQNLAEAGHIRSMLRLRGFKNWLRLVKSLALWGYGGIHSLLIRHLK